jgi:hypothetical protein
MAFEQFAADLQVRVVVPSIVCDLQGALYCLYCCWLVLISY